MKRCNKIAEAPKWRIENHIKKSIAWGVALSIYMGNFVVPIVYYNVVGKEQ